MSERENLENGLRKTVRITKKILRNPITRRVVIVVVAIALVIIFCGSAYDALTDAFSKNVSEHVKNNPVQYSTSDNSIIINDETIDGLITVIKNMGIDLGDLKLTRDDIAKLYAAEVVSSEINRINEANGEKEEDGKYYGRVFLKRENPDTGELERLIFEPDLNKFEQMSAPEILKYFSMDGDKICIASTQTSNDNEGNIATIHIDKLSYKDDISQYTVPIEFLLDLCFISQNPGFVLALADKIINETEIVIQVLQDTTTTKTSTTYTYYTETETSTRRDKFDVDGNYTPPSTHNTSEPVIYGPESNTTTQIQTTVASKIKIKSVKNWIMEVNYNYNKVTSTYTDEPEPEKLKDEAKKAHQYTFFKRENNNDGGYTDIYTSTITRRIRQTTSTKIVTTSETYQNGISEGVKDKVDEFIEMLKTPYLKVGSFQTEASIYKLKNGAEMFFQMLQNGSRTQPLEQLMRYILSKATGVDYGVSEFDFSTFDIKDFSSTAGSARSLADYLRQFSHSNEAPKSEDGKYYKLYGDGEGWPTIGNADLQWKSHASKFDVSGKVLANGIEKEVTSIRNYVNSFLARGETAKYTDSEIDNMQIYIEKEKVDEIGNEIQAVYYNAVQRCTGGLNLSKQQLYALTTIQYNFGHLPERNGYTFVEAYQAATALYEVNSWEHNRFVWDNWWAYLGGGAPGHIPSRDAAYETYVKGVYDFSRSDAGKVFGRNYYIYYTQTQLNRFSYAPNKHITRTEANEQEIFTYVKGRGSILDAAYEVADHFMNSGVTVHYAGAGIEGSENGIHCIYGNIQGSWDYPIENPNEYGVVCATYVSLTLWKAGLIDEETINQYNYNYCPDVESMLTNSSYANEWKKITNFNELQEGDVVFFKNYAHVYIYIGEGKGLDQAYCVVRSSGTDDRGKPLAAYSSDFLVAYRYTGK